MKTLILLLLLGSAISYPYPKKFNSQLHKKYQKYYRARYNLQKLQTYENRYGQDDPSVEKARPANQQIDVDRYVKEALNHPLPTDSRIQAPTDQSSPSAAAALEYMRKLDKDEFCGLPTQVYLQNILAGKSKEVANAEATRVYIQNYNNGADLPTSGACAAAANAWREAWSQDADPVLAASLAFMENWDGVKEGNPCAVSGVDYVKAVMDGKTHLQANQIAAVSFAKAIKSLAMNGKELKDKACRDSTLAFFKSVPQKPDPANAAAFTAFMEKIFQGGRDVYDPVCFASLEGYMDAYMKGEDLLTANLMSAKNFFEAFIKGDSSMPADSPCAAATLAYTKEIAKKPSNANAAAMVSYIAEAIQNKERKLDPVCGAATLAYWDAYLTHQSEDKADEAAAVAYLETLDQHPDFDQTSACAKSARAYMDNFETK